MAGQRGARIWIKEVESDGTPSRDGGKEEIRPPTNDERREEQEAMGERDRERGRKGERETECSQRWKTSGQQYEFLNRQPAKCAFELPDA